MFNPFLVSLLRHELYNSDLLIREALRGLKIKVVGGAEYWDKVKDADFVVRINQHYLRQGGRVNALYVGPGLDTWELDCHPSFIAYSGAHVNYTSKWFKLCTDIRATDYRYYSLASKQANPFGVDAQWCNTLNHELGTNPLTGIIAIAHLLTLPIASLHITGFTFYASGSEIPLMRDSHHLVSQFEWLKARAKFDTRITLDDQLKELMSSSIAFTMTQTSSVGEVNKDIKRIMI